MHVIKYIILKFNLRCMVIPYRNTSEISTQPAGMLLGDHIYHFK